MQVGYKANHQLNILFISHDAYPAGAQYLLLALTSWLKDSGFVNPRFIINGPGDLFEEFLRIGPVLRTNVIDDEKKVNPNRTDEKVLRSFCGEDIAAVYLNSAASGHLVELTRHLKAPHIAHIHELEKSIERWAGPKKMSALRNHTDLFIAASEPVATNLSHNHEIPPPKIKVVDAFINCSGIREISDAEKRRCKAALGLDPQAKIVLGCGTTDWRKGPDLFIEIAQRLLSAYKKPVQFIWLGGETRLGEIEELERLASEKGLENIVRFMGAVDTPLPYMIASDLFLLPSREDPFPLVCLEAADCGLPIICFADAGGMPEFVGTDGGAVISYLDVDGMADSIKSFLTDADKLRQCGTQARKRVREHLDVSVKGKEIFTIIEKLIGSGNNGDFRSNGSSGYGKNDDPASRRIDSVSEVRLGS